MAHLLLDSSAKSASSLCRVCCNNASRAGTRFFSSSASMMVGPESPEFVDVPRPIQPFHPQKGEVKGTLPVPREIFPRRRPDKPTQSYLDDVTPEPTKDGPKVPRSHPQYELLEWKRKMASTRRQNLRQGLKELYYRKRDTEARLSKRSAKKIQDAKEVQSQPPREDERLTAQSTTKEMQIPELAYLPDPHAKERLEESKAKTAAKQESKRQKRLEAIQTLYMNARHFITTEKQLMDEIERVFPEGENPAWTNSRQEGGNIWNLGPPMTIEKMVAKRQNDGHKVDIVQERTKKIAENLTGGKL